jgi:hypothetical protein
MLENKRMSVYIGLAVQLLKEGAEVRVVKVSPAHKDVFVSCEVDAKNESDYIDGLPLMRWNKDRTKLDLSEDLGIVYHVVVQ